MDAIMTISVEEYKELVEFKIRAEFEDKIRALEADVEATNKHVDYWFNEYCNRGKELDNAFQQIAALKDRLRNYEPEEEGGEA